VNKDIFTSLAGLLDMEKIMVALLLLIATWVGLFLLQRLVGPLADKFPQQRLLISSLFPILRLLIWILATSYIVLAILRPPYETIVLVAGASGVAIGLGTQDLVKNVLAGVLILIERPFRVGDMIRSGQFYGEVTAIGLRASQLHSFDDSKITLPNALLLNDGIVNSNDGALYELVEVEISLPAEVPTQQVKSLAYDAALCSPYVYGKKPITVLVRDHFEYGCFLNVFKIKAYTIDLRFERLLASDVIERLKVALVARGLYGNHGTAIETVE
jgi:small-conductance mechanosensitive channel